jgi:hypothetical protein
MNFNYATLQNYNEVYSSDLSNYTPQYDNELKNINVYDAVLEGDNMEPENDTIAHGNLILILDREVNGFFVSLNVHKIKDPIECVLQLLDKDDMVSETIMTIWKDKLNNLITGRLTSTFFSLNKIGYNMNDFYNLLCSQKVIVTIKTKSFPNGEIDGILKKIY